MVSPITKWKRDNLYYQSAYSERKSIDNTIRIPNSSSLHFEYVPISDSMASDSSEFDFINGEPFLFDIDEVFDEVLNEYQKKVIKLWFGLYDGWDNEKPSSYQYEEIGDVMGLTAERIRMIKETGLQKLRTYFWSRK